MEPLHGGLLRGPVSRVTETPGNATGGVATLLREDVATDPATLDHVLTHGGGHGGGCRDDTGHDDIAHRVVRGSVETPAVFLSEDAEVGEKFADHVTVPT